MTLSEQLADDMAAAILDHGQTFEWQGQSYPCVRRDQPTISELQEAGGEIERTTYFLVVAKSAFPGARPQEGDLVNSKAHQIKAVNGDKDPFAAQLTLTIGSLDE